MYRIINNLAANQYFGKLTLMAGDILDLPSIPDEAGHAVATGAVTVIDLDMVSSMVAVGSLTRLANTTAYASGQLVAQSATAGSCTGIALAAARVAGRGGRITGVRLAKTGTVVTNAAFRVHVFRKNPTFANADAGTFASGVNGLASVEVGYFDVTIDQVYSDGARGFVDVNDRAFVTDAGSVNVYAVIEARAAYTPASAEVFTVELEVLAD